MGKFEMELELTGFKLKVKGDRADVPLITQNIGSQIAGLLQPAANIVEGESPTAKKVTNESRPAAQIEEKPSTGRSRKRSNGTGDASTAYDIQHDSAKWGDPLQAWNPTNKSVWLMHVLDQSGGSKEPTSGEIAATFNKNYKSAGALRASNVSRDLKKVSGGASGLVVADSASGKFSLSNAGKAKAAVLVNEAKSGVAAGAI